MLLLRSYLLKIRRYKTKVESLLFVSQFPKAITDVSFIILSVITGQQKCTKSANKFCIIIDKFCIIHTLVDLTIQEGAVI